MAANVKAIAENLLREAKKLAGAEAYVSVSSARDANTRFGRGEITSTRDVEQVSIGLSITFGKRSASVSLNQFDDASLRAAVARAARMARLAPEDPEHMPLLGPQRYPPVPPVMDPALDKLPATSRAEVAAAAIIAADAAGVQLAGNHTHNTTRRTIATSAGLRASHDVTSAYISMTARTPGGDGSGWAATYGEHLAQLDPAGCTRTAIDKAVRSQKPRRLEPGRYTVILEPAAASDLLDYFVGALDARSADEGRSFFSRPGGGTKLGDKLVSEAITIKSDPADPLMPNAPFDGEGHPLTPITWVDKGKLNALSYSRFWAQKQGKPSTGGHPDFHLLGGSAANTAELIKGTERGVLITRFWYSNLLDDQSMMVTGLTRDGVFLIEKGEIAYPVNNFRFNESPVTMLANVEAMTRDGVRHGTNRVPALRTRGFNLASVSEAV